MKVQYDPQTDTLTILLHEIVVLDTQIADVLTNGRGLL